MSNRTDWTRRGHDLARHYTLDTLDLRGYPNDDAMRLAVTQEHYPGAEPTYRRYLREGWRAQRAGERP